MHFNIPLQNTPKVSVLPLIRDKYKDLGGRTENKLIGKD
jgi:hypothetical protein